MTARRGPLPALAALSFSLLYLEVTMIRLFSLVAYHHFTYLAIGTGLLGYAASAWVVHGYRSRPTRSLDRAAFFCTALFALAIPLAARTAFYVAPDWRFLAFDSGQIGRLGLTVSLLFLPFFFGASAVGLLLRARTAKLASWYGVNLGAGALGSFAVPVVLGSLPPFAAMIAAAVPAAGAALLILPHLDLRRRAQTLVLFWAAALIFFLGLPLLVPDEASLPWDPYKDVTRVLEWKASGKATLISSGYGRTAVYDLFSSPYFHFGFFAGLGTDVGASQEVLFLDGDMAGVFVEQGDRALLLTSPQSLPYRLIPRAAKVLILGDQGNAAIEMAIEAGASAATVVQPDRSAARIQRTMYPSDRILPVARNPRAYLDSSPESYDLVHLASAEGLPAGTGGTRSLTQDYLLTVEGIASALGHSRPSGVVSLTRGIQYPARDGLKLIATAAEALRSIGIEDPGTHMIVLRNYLALNVLISPESFAFDRSNKIARLAAALNLDVEFLPDGSGGPPYRHRLAETGIAADSVYRTAAIAWAGSTGPDFARGWMYDVSPARDDAPFFHAFFRSHTIGALRSALGASWIRGVDSATLAVWAALIILVVLGIAFILAPMLVISPAARLESVPYLLYFALVGLGFMFLETALIARVTRFLADPVLGSSAVLGSLLAASGFGSLVQGRLSANPARRILMAVSGLWLVGGLITLRGPYLGTVTLTWPFVAQFTFACGLGAVLGFFLGWFFSAGVELWCPAAADDDDSFALAWGINGFFSVIAPSVTVLIALGEGYTLVFAVGLLCYLGAGFAILRTGALRTSG